jgi:predicted RNA-binding protein YlqC (UPF0109 family)
LKGLVGFLARALVDHPDDVQVDGRQGRTARSMRLVLSAAAAKVERRATLEIAD